MDSVNSEDLNISDLEFTAVADQIDMVNAFATEGAKIAGKEIEKREDIDISGEYDSSQVKGALAADFDYEEIDSNQLEIQLNKYYRIQKQPGMNIGQLIGHSRSAKAIQELITTVGANTEDPSQSQHPAYSEAEPVGLPFNSEMRSDQDIERGRSRQRAPFQPPSILAEDLATFSSSINHGDGQVGNHTYNEDLLHPDWRPSHLANPPRITIEDCTPSASVNQVTFHESYSRYNCEFLHAHWQPQLNVISRAKRAGTEESEVFIHAEPEDLSSMDSINIRRATDGVGIEKSLLEWAQAPNWCSYRDVIHLADDSERADTRGEGTWSMTEDINFERVEHGDAPPITLSSRTD